MNFQTRSSTDQSRNFKIPVNSSATPYRQSRIVSSGADRSGTITSSGVLPGTRKAPRWANPPPPYSLPVFHPGPGTHEDIHPASAFHAPCPAHRLSTGKAVIQTRLRQYSPRLFLCRSRRHSCRIFRSFSRARTSFAPGLHSVGSPALSMSSIRQRRTL